MAQISLKAYLIQVQERMEAQDYNAVIQHCRHILREFPKNVDAYHLLGRGLFQLSRWEESAEVFRRLLGTLPMDFTAHYSLSRIYSRMKQLEPAIWHMERAFDQQPNNEEVLNSLRELYKEARGQAVERLQLTAGAVAHQHLRNDLPEQAVAVLRKAIGKFPNRADLKLLLAEALWMTGHEMDSAETAVEVLQTLPYALNGNRILTELWLREQRPSDAQRYLSRIEELDPYLAFHLATGDEPADDLLLLQELDYETLSRHQLTVESPDWLDAIDQTGDFEAVSADVADVASGKKKVTDDLSDLLPDDYVAPDAGELDFDMDDSLPMELADDEMLAADLNLDEMISDEEIDDLFGDLDDLDLELDDDSPDFLSQLDEMAELSADETLLAPPQNRDERVSTGLTGMLDQLSDTDDLDWLKEVQDGSLDLGDEALAESINKLDTGELDALLGGDEANAPADEPERVSTGLTGLLTTLDDDDDMDWLDEAQDGSLDEQPSGDWLDEVDSLEGSVVGGAPTGRASTGFTDELGDEAGVSDTLAPSDDSVEDFFADVEEADNDTPDPMAWLSDSGMEDEGDDEPRLSTSEMPATDAADPLAWLEGTGVEITEGEADDLYVDPYGVEEDGVSLESADVDPMAWLADSGIEVEADESVPAETDDDAMPDPMAWLGEDNLADDEADAVPVADVDEMLADDVMADPDKPDTGWLEDDTMLAEMMDIEGIEALDDGSIDDLLDDIEEETFDLAPESDEFDFFADEVDVEGLEDAPMDQLDEAEELDMMESDDWNFEDEDGSEDASTELDDLEWIGDDSDDSDSAEDTSDDMLPNFFDDDEIVTSGATDLLVGDVEDILSQGDVGHTGLLEFLNKMDDPPQQAPEDGDDFDFGGDDESFDWEADAPSDQTDALSMEEADWLSEVPSELGEEADDEFDWEVEESPVEEEADWLAEISVDNGEADEAVASDDLDWLEAETEAEPEGTLQTGPINGGDDWLAELNVEEEGDGISDAFIEDGEEFDIDFGEDAVAETEADDGEFPDWLGDTSSQPIEAGTDASEAEDEFPDWLQDTPSVTGALSAMAEDMADNEAEDDFSLEFEGDDSGDEFDLDFSDEPAEEGEADWLADVGDLVETASEETQASMSRIGDEIDSLFGDDDDDDEFDLDFSDEPAEEAVAELGDDLSYLFDDADGDSEDEFDLDFSDEPAEEAEADWLAEIGDSVEDAGEEVEEAVAEMSDEFGDLFDSDDQADDEFSLDFTDEPAEEGEADWLSEIGDSVEDAGEEVEEAVAEMSDEFGDLFDSDDQADDEFDLDFSDEPAEEAEADWLADVGASVEDAGEEVEEAVAEMSDEFADFLDGDDDSDDEFDLDFSDEPAEEGEADWLADIGDTVDEAGDEMEDAIAEMSDGLGDLFDDNEEGDEFDLDFSDEPVAEADDDWLAGIGESVEEAGDEFEEAVAEADDDWLAGIGESVEEAEDEFEAVADESDDWLSGVMDGVDDAIDDAEDEFDSFIEDEEAEPAYAMTDDYEDQGELTYLDEMSEDTEIAPASNAPDWLNAMVPGLDVDYEADEDAPMDEGFLEEEAVHASTESGEGFDWLTDIVEEETDQVASVSPLSFIFSRLPRWLRGGDSSEASATAVMDEPIVTEAVVDEDDWDAGFEMEDFDSEEIALDMEFDDSEPPMMEQDESFNFEDDLPDWLDFDDLDDDD